MLTIEEKEIIEKYVDDTYYDKDKLIKYLTMHDVVVNEVFSYCDRKKNRQGRNWLDDEQGYVPLSVSGFVKRVPFYFYTEHFNCTDMENIGSLHFILAAFYSSGRNRSHDIESVYEALEYMFYSLKLPLSSIFNYWIEQTGFVSSYMFFEWHHYLHLCEELGRTDYFPERFITAYNEVLELSNLPPIIYEVSETGFGNLFFRDATRIRFEGRFPCDADGMPIMKWIGIRATNIKDIRCTCEKSMQGFLLIDITPDTIIHVRDFFNRLSDDEEDCWFQAYAGPKTMQFDHMVLKKRRKELGFTQQEVADAVETTVRTYQKWESGETTPDGHFLIRLLNWLDIPDIQNAIEYKEISE